jgi:hypothetical protein
VQQVGTRGFCEKNGYMQTGTRDAAGIVQLLFQKAL